MTQVCLLGKPGVNLRYELLSRETARQALATYDLREPFENSVAVETVSLGAAVALLNDLNWYLVRFVDDAFVLEPSISEDEWLSRDLATTIRDDAVEEDENGRFLAVYGLETGAHGIGDGGRGANGSDDNTDGARGAGGGTETADSEATEERTESNGGVESEDGVTAEGDGEAAEADGSPDALDEPKLVEPMLVTRTGGAVPEYDLRDVDDTLVVRLTKSEFGA